MESYLCLSLLPNVMSFNLLLYNASFPELEDPCHYINSALYGAQMLKELPSLYWKLSRKNATLFSYALYNILSRDSRYQPEAEKVIKGLEKAYSSLEETITRHRAEAIILDEKEKIGYYTPDLRGAIIEEDLRFYLFRQAFRGYLRREAEKIYRAFANGGFSAQR